MYSIEEVAKMLDCKPELIRRGWNIKALKKLGSEYIIEDSTGQYTITEKGYRYLNDEVIKFKRYDSNLIEMCRINDIIDEKTDGAYMSIVSGKDVINGFRKTENSIELNENGQEMVKRYIGENEDIYEYPTAIDYKLLYEMLRKMYLDTDLSIKTPSGQDPYKSTPLNLGADPVQKLKEIAGDFYTDMFTVDGEIQGFAKKTLKQALEMLRGDEGAISNIMVYEYNQEAKEKGLPDGPSNRAVDGKNAICIPLDKDDNGNYIVTLQNLYDIVHEMSHSLEHVIHNNKKNSRTANMMGENESMFVESLFSHFLYKKIEQQEITGSRYIEGIRREDIMKYEHGPSRVRGSCLTSLFKLGCFFYQADLKSKGLFNPTSDIIDYEDKEIQRQVMEFIFPGRYEEMSQTEIDNELSMVQRGIEDLRDHKAHHTYTDYFSCRYYIGNIIAPYMANTYFADKEKGLEMLEAFWATGTHQDIDRNGGMEAVLKAIGIVITRDENGNIIDSPNGLPDIHMLTSEYNEWISNASRQNGDMFNGKTRVVPSRILTQESMEEQKEPLFLDSIEAQQKRQERAIEESKENQDIGE